MRVFNFKARNIGEEKYLTYTMGEDCELDEDVLDYCEENNLKELVDIIYEEDDDYDYLTYDITGKVSLEDYIADEMKAEQVLFLVRNVATNLISFKEQAIQLSYILLNRNYIYVGDKMELQFICLPIENKAAVAAEFKSFIRQLLANMRYDVEEELSYVGKLLTYINSDSFNLRGLIGLTEALMEEAGLTFEEAGSIDADGVEVVNEKPAMAEEETTKVSDFMSSMEDAEELPEIGDDEEDETADAMADDEELESILPAGMSALKEDDIEIPTITENIEEDVTETAEEIVEEATEEKVEEVEEVKQETAPVEAVKAEKTKIEQPAPAKETDVDVIKSRIKELVGTVPTLRPQEEPAGEIKTLDDLDQVLGNNRPPVIKKNVVKVNRAALIQSAAEHEGETEKLEGPGPVEAELTPATPATPVTPAAPATPVTPAAPVTPASPVVEEEVEEKPKSNSILSKTVAEIARPSIFSAPKANPYLIRVNTEERIMLGKVVFKIGKASRGVDYTVGGNSAISRQHAVIIQRDGVCYIKDNKSTNHTYVNDKMVEEGVEEILTHDSKIRLGDEEFLFKIR